MAQSLEKKIVRWLCENTTNHAAIMIASAIRELRDADDHHGLDEPENSALLTLERMAGA